MKTEIELVNIDGGNKGSVLRLLERLCVSVKEVDANNFPTGNRAIILPGVGAFGAVMETLEKSGLNKRLCDLVNSGTPYLGICVGMQVLFEKSEESPGISGLSLVPGEVVRFTKGKVPQIGWNKIESSDTSRDSGYTYFVNSYFAVPKDNLNVLYAADYHERFCAAVETGNITGFQFHPEKSGDFGQVLMRKWLEKVK